MLEQLQSRFRKSLVALLAGPPIALLLVFTVMQVLARQSAHIARFEGEAAGLAGRMERVLRAESARLQTLSRIPAASAVAQAAQRRDDQKISDEIQLEQLWARSSREDLTVRSVLDNDIAAMFRRLLEHDAHLSDLLLSDTHGHLLAAPQKTERYSQRQQPWWEASRNVAPGEIGSPGIAADGELDLGTTVIRAGRRTVVDGVLHVRVDLNPLMGAAGLTSTPGRVMVVLGGSAPWIVSRAGDDARAAKFADKLHLRADAGGHLEGFRYFNLPLDGGIAWTNPVRMIVGVSEAELPPGAFLVPAGLFLLGAGLLVAVGFVAAPALNRQFFEPLRESSDAGLWALRTAFGRGGAGGRSSAIQKELAAWYAKLQQELQRQNVNIAADVARDLELATEFQQAFLNRPYPDIPEVHMAGRLRLDFYHCYQPALAMGGDFFDVTALANDCAGVFVGDVMGHGTRSALLVAMLRTLIAEQSRRGRNAPHFLRALNNEFCNLLKALPQPIFASAAYFVADTTARIATYSVAGHPPPFHLHRERGRVTRLEMPKPQGAAMGLMPNEEYGGGTVRLAGGDAFIFFTDGVYEAANAAGEEFGLARLEKLIRANVYRGSREILDGVMQAIIDFVGAHPVADDICLVAVDVSTDSR